MKNNDIKAKIEYITEEDYCLNIEKCIKTNIYVTRPWIIFLKKIIKGKLVFLRITFKDCVSFLYGAIIKKGPIKIFASPFAQWNTGYIGFMSQQPIDEYGPLIKGVFSFLKKKEHIAYCEIIDKNISVEQAKKTKVKYEIKKNLYIDLTKDEEDILSNFSRGIKKRCRNYKNHGYDIIKVEPDAAFINVFYEQLCEVFARQNLKPFYDKQRIVDILDSFKSFKDNVLCLQSINTCDNTILSSGIYLGYKDFSISIASAYYMATKSSGMNHPVRWEAMRYWKNKGATIFDMCGYNPYKLSFGPDVVEMPAFYLSTIPFLHLAKRIIAWFISKRRKKNTEE